MWFGLGLLIGGLFVFFIVAACHVAHESEEKHDKEVQN